MLALDSTRWRVAMDRLRRVKQQRMFDFLTEQFRLLLEQIMRFTPPKDLAQGRKRVVTDIRKVFRIFDVTTTTSTRLKEIIRKGDQRAFEAYARASNQPWRAVTFSPAVHAAARDRRGRVNRSGRNAPFILGRKDEAALRAYVRKKQQSVGVARSGWSAALIRVGGANLIPSWVSRHGIRYGDVIDRRSAVDKPELIAVNRTPWANRRDEGQRVIGNAMRSRVRRLESALRVQLRLAAQESGIRAA